MQMKPKLYMETSVISYLAARPSKDSILAGQQASTHRWWREKRRNYEIFVSKIVWQEASKGDATAVGRRLKLIHPFRWLQATSPVINLARALVGKKAVPQNAADDATHIALGAVYGMEFLLTWNFTHINNPATEELVREVCRQHGFHCPVICTPDQLLSV
jgi:predicted nucleic acid-binding protein